MTNPISNQPYVDARVLQQPKSKSLQAAETPVVSAGEKSVTTGTSDTVTISRQTETTAATYSHALTLEQGVAGDGYDLLRGLVLNILKEQGIDYKIANGDQEIDISQLSQEEAQELIAEDGYFGVEQTSDRIVEFAIGMAGNDPSRLAVMKEGVEKGFNEALDAFGGWLPDISYETYDAVMQKLDTWAENANTDQQS